MPFFHGEHFFLQKDDHLERESDLLEAEKLHKTHKAVQFFDHPNPPLPVRILKKSFIPLNLRFVTFQGVYVHPLDENAF